MMTEYDAWVTGKQDDILVVQSVVKDASEYEHITQAANPNLGRSICHHIFRS